MESSFKKELIRKQFHLLGAAIPISYYFIEKPVMIGLLTLLLIISIIYETIRIYWKKEIPLFKKYYRPEEKNQYAAAVPFFLGALLSVALFDKQIAIAALLMVVFGDLAAGLIGTKYGKHMICSTKSWEGFIAGLVVNLAIVYLVTSNLPITILMAFSGSLAEVSSDHVDDNLSMPLLSGLVGQILKSAY